MTCIVANPSVNLDANEAGDGSGAYWSYLESRNLSDFIELAMVMAFRNQHIAYSAYYRICNLSTLAAHSRKQPSFATEN